VAGTGDKRKRKARLSGLLVVTLMLLALGGELAACDLTQFQLAEKRPLASYTLVLFHQPGRPADDAALAVVNQLSEKWGERANLDFKTVNVTRRRGAKTAKYWKVETFPLACLVTPTGWWVATFEGKLDPTEIEAFFTSPGKVALLASLKQRPAVFLIIGHQKMKGFAPAVAAAGKAAKSAEKLMAVKVGTLIVDPTDRRERGFLRNLGLADVPKEPKVFVTFGQGLAVLRQVGVGTLDERLAFTIQLLATADQCSLGEEIRGEPLLLGK